MVRRSIVMSVCVQGGDGRIDDGDMSGGRGGGGTVCHVHDVDVSAVVGPCGDGGDVDVALCCAAPTSGPTR